jgi:hypothetical protein
MSSEKSVKIKFASEEIAATHGMSTTMQEGEFSIYRNLKQDLFLSHNGNSKLN